MKFLFQPKSHIDEELLVPYNSITRLPLSITLKKCSFINGFITSNNWDECNLIEFTFDKPSMNLCGIDLINLSRVYKIDKMLQIPLILNQYEAFIETRSFRNRTNIHTECYRYKDAIAIQFHKRDIQKYYPVSPSVTLTVDDEGSLCSIYVHTLTVEILNTVFGF